MNPQFIFPVVVMGAAAVIALLVGLVTTRWRNSPGGSYFILLMVAVAIYAFTNAAEQAVFSVAAKIIWSKLAYIGIVSVSPLWFLFTKSYGQRASRMTRSQMVVLWFLPVVTLGMVATNGWHRLIWSTITVVSSGSATRLIYGHGIGFWVHAAYAYALLLMGTFFLVRIAWRSNQLFRWQLRALLSAAFFPWLANLLYLLEINPWPGLDLTPLGFLLTGLIISWALFRFQILDLVPVAHDILFESIGDGVIVLDKWNRIIDLNPTAREWMGVSDEGIGRQIGEVVQSNEVLTKYESVIEAQSRLEIGEGEALKVFDLTISPLRDVRGQVQGRIVSLHDISREHDLLESERLHSRQMELLNAITEVALSMPDLQQMLQELADRLGELFSADGAYLTLWNEEQQRAIPAAAYGIWRDKYHALFPKPNEQTVTEAALMAGHTLAIEDATDTPYLSPRIAALFPTRSMLALPLIVDKQKLGAVIISFNQIYHFTPEEIELGEQVARQIALAMIKIKLYETEKKRGGQLAALQTISQVVVSSLDLNQIFETVVQVLQDTFGYHYVSIYYLEGDTLRLGTQAGSPDDMVYEEISIDEGVSGRAVRTRQPQFVPDVAKDPDYMRINNDIEREICVPLIKDQTVLGTLNVEASSRYPLAKSDVTLLTTFANQVAVAIENARLFTETRRRAKKERLLFWATRDFTARLGEEAVYQAIVRHMTNALELEGCAISRWDAANDSIETLLDYAPSAEYPLDNPRTTYALTDYPLTREVLENREPISIHVDDPSIDPNEGALLKKYGNASLLMLPLVIGKGTQVFGIVELYGKPGSSPFSEDELELARSLVAQAATAIENARLYAEVNRLATIDELTGLYNRRGFYEIGRREWNRAIRYEKPLAALFLDIDHFKLFNDVCSYAIGDNVLRLLADCLRDNLREADVAGRYGGEEFVVLLPETKLQSAVEAAERLRIAAKNMRVKTDLGEVNITMSIGVSQLTPDLPNLESLIDLAWQALRQAKGEGRNRVIISDSIAGDQWDPIMGIAEKPVM